MVVCKQIIVLMLLLAVLGQTFNRAVIVTSYYANSAAFAKNCENKAKLTMHCNGKCQMMKKMKQEENRDKQAPERRNNPDEVLFSRSFFSSVQVLSLPNLRHFTWYTSKVPKSINSEFFHPPGV